jgi:hypothetical protein
MPEPDFVGLFTEPLEMLGLRYMTKGAPNPPIAVADPV